ncbi:hypothetical protein EJ02DRAFT_505892 [Clathrospora elynae]|uniref:Phosphoribosyltransferase domain-containing protein n=1 Tax=Clathrospora elynae TaxID=706981 RepID=A0A6A5SD64_9PLEO|nr:hypothetical protein EJ02DRAFT_505892 [Clathrospora elynae]
MSAPGSSKPVIIGMYGISGCGKTYLTNQLKDDTSFPEEHFSFFDGSTLIDRVVKGGLEVFKRMDAEQQQTVRAEAIIRVSDDCKKSNRIAVITGHLMLWDDEAAKEMEIGTTADWATYSHIIYLNFDAGVVATRRKDDTTKKRREVPVELLHEWQNQEQKMLRDKCIEHGILFTSISETCTPIEKSSLRRLTVLLKDFQQQNEVLNASAVNNAVELATAGQIKLETMLMLDADKTLAPQDTGALFWKMNDPASRITGDPLRLIFETQGYSYSSFRQATLLYEEVADEFDARCDKVATEVEMHPEMVELLKRVEKEPHVGAIIVTCGIRRVWEKVLMRYGLSHISVIGGGRLADGYVVTGLIKGHVADQLHEKKLRVVAFGDSPLDIEMLRKADEAYVVVGDESTRSTSMDEVLAKVIHKQGLSALQVALPKTAKYRLDLDTLPKTTLDNAELDFIFRRGSSARFVHATDKNSAKLLMTATRDAANRSHALRKAHERVGQYLALEYLSDIVGLQEIEIQHVQQRATDGHRFRHEKATLIVPMMRGGEPMAFGVSQVMPAAGFAHAKVFSDIDFKNFQGKRTVILVDSVINTGKSIAEFVKSLRDKYPHVRVIIVAGVVQANAVVIQVVTGPDIDNRFAEMLRDDRELYVVALRKSENSFKGQGVTDTGHRLFNTTRLD